MKISISKKLGEYTGKIVAESKALPKKTVSTTKSIKDEFLAGFDATNGSPKEKGNQPPAQNG
jgi:hypothetical protein